MGKWSGRCVGAGALALSGCGRLVEIEVSVRVPRDVQERFFGWDDFWEVDPAERRGRVVLALDQSNLQRTVSLDILCGVRPESTLVLAYETAGMGCAAAGRIRAWLEPVPPEETSYCAPGQEVLSGRALFPDPAWPQAAERVLESLSEDERCGAVSGTEDMVVRWALEGTTDTGVSQTRRARSE